MEPALADEILAAQLLVAWAGEGGEESRLGWWRSDLLSEFGGEALFKRVVPRTWQWATYQAAREVARRTDEELRKKEHNHDGMVSIYHFGFIVDESLDERLREHKLASRSPIEALPILAEVIGPGWSRDRFDAWVRHHGKADVTRTTGGRRLRGGAPESPTETLRSLIAALDPLGDAYPLPHFRRDS